MGVAASDSLSELEELLELELELELELVELESDGDLPWAAFLAFLAAMARFAI